MNDRPAQDELLTRLGGADTPYRAWAATSLLSSSGEWYRAEGKRIATELADWMPPAGEFEHADIAGYALLSGAGFLDTSQRARLLDAVPFPHRVRERRAKLYGSSVYLYLIARGLARQVDFQAELVQVINEEIEQVCERVSPDLVDLSLLLAARLEFDQVFPLTAEQLRAFTGRIAGAEGNPDGAAALEWFLEFYYQRLPRGDAAEAILDAIERYVARTGTPTRTPPEDRPVLTAMLLERATRVDPEFRLVSRAGEEAAVVRRLGRRRLSEGTAYLVVVAIVAGLPMYLAVRGNLFGTEVGVAGALGLGVPAATFALLLVTGRPRDPAALGVGVTLGLVYYLAALFAGFTRNAEILRIVEGEGALVELLIAAATAIWAGIGSRPRP